MVVSSNPTIASKQDKNKLRKPGKGPNFDLDIDGLKLSLTWSFVFSSWTRMLRTAPGYEIVTFGFFGLVVLTT